MNIHAGGLGDLHHVRPEELIPAPETCAECGATLTTGTPTHAAKSRKRLLETVGMPERDIALCEDCDNLFERWLLERFLQRGQLAERGIM